MARFSGVYLAFLVVVGCAVQVAGNSSAIGETGLLCVSAIAQSSFLDRGRRGFATGQSLPYDAGKYSMCLQVPNSRYFLVSMQATLKQPSLPDAFVADQRHGSAEALFPDLAGRRLAAATVPSLPFELGFCVPDACSAADAPLFIGLLSPTLMFLNISQVSAVSPELDVLPKDGSSTAALGFVVVLALMVLGSTGAVFTARMAGSTGEQARAPLVSPGPHIDGESPQSSATPHGDRSRVSGNVAFICQAFSMVGRVGTVPKLVEQQPYKQTDCLNGLRVLSMIWIILGHTFLMAKAIAGYSNLQDLIDTPLQQHSAEDDPLLMVIISAQMGVDTFFFLSGFLLAHVTLKELRNRQGRINILAAVLMRYLRLTPSLAFVMLVYYKIWPYLGYGPFAPRFQASILSRCDTSWWSELTYTINFFPFDSDKVCMGWTWYLGDDMIFFILGMCLLPVYFRRRWQGWLSLVLLAGVSIGVTVWLILHYGLSVYVFDNHYTQYSLYAYSKPYTRAPAYFVGIAAAWMLDDMEGSRLSRPSGAVGRVVAHIAAAVAAATLLFLVFIPTTDFGKRKNTWGGAASAMYLTLGRPLWALCWAVITFLCYFGFLPVVDGILSSGIWTPLARLTYGAYLLHPLVIKLAAGNAVQYYTFSYADILYRFIGNCAYAYAGAALLWLLVERPVMTLSSLVFQKRHSQSLPDRVEKVGSTTGVPCRLGGIMPSPFSPTAATTGNSR